MAATTRTVTADTDLTVHKYVHSIYATDTNSTAATVALKRGSGSGDVVWQTNIKADDNAGQTFYEPMFIKEGVYVDITGAATVTLVVE